MEDVLLWLAPLLLVAIIIGALLVRWLRSDWRCVRNTGIWLYEVHRVNGVRRITRIGAGSQPVDHWWLSTGQWIEPTRPPSAAHARSRRARFGRSAPLVLLFVCVLAAPAFATSEYAASRKITYRRAYAPLSVQVIDGDTVHASLKGGVRKIRLVGIDAPELHVACQAERGRAARSALAAFVVSGRVLIKEANQLDKYGRRLGGVRVGNVDAARHLLTLQLVRPYGGGKRPTWPGCE